MMAEAVMPRPDKKLLNAVVNGSPESTLLQLIDEEGADVNFQYWDGRTPLLAAAAKGDVEAIRLLISKGARVDKRDHLKATPLWIASRAGHKDAVEALVLAGAAIDARSLSAVTPLCIAAQEGHDEVVECLLDYGANVGVATGNATSPFWLSCAKGHLPVAELLYYRGGASLREMSKGGLTPLSIASFHGHTAVVVFLLKALVEEDEATMPTGDAASAEKGSVGSERVRKGVSEVVNIFGNLRRTALSLAAEEGHAEIVRQLLANGADVNFRDGMGMTPLTKAISHGRERVAGLLLEAGADPNVVVKAQDSGCCLHFACKEGCAAVVKAVLSHPSFELGVDCRDGVGRTPLFYAAANNDEGLADLLLSYGASAGAVDNEGRTPLFTAADNDADIVVRYLLDLSTRGDCSREQSAVSSETTVGVDEYDSVFLVTIPPIDVDAASYDGVTALHRAAARCNRDIVQLLLKEGADPLRETHDNEAALSLALAPHPLTDTSERIEDREAIVAALLETEVIVTTAAVERSKNSVGTTTQKKLMKKRGIQRSLTVLASTVSEESPLSLLSPDLLETIVVLAFKTEADAVNIPLQ